jgi:D-alanyl-D-alanine carboxypeptidase
LALASKSILAGVIAALLVAGSAQAKIKTASMVIDADTGEVLEASNVDSRSYPASLTKMMTLYLLFDAMEAGKLHLADHMPVSRHAADQAPTKLGVAAGKTLSVEDAMLGMITRSANDAAVVVAEYLGGTESGFAQKMTQKAHELGMNKTEFFNASGLPNMKQKSTARDMATLARALLHHHPKEYKYFATTEFDYDGTTIHGHNHLMESYDGADGIKTGYTDASGFNLVASAKRDGRRLIGVVFGGSSAGLRDKQMAHLLDAAFVRTPGSAGVELAELPEQPDQADVPVKGKKGKVQVAARTPLQRQSAAGDADDEWAIELGAFSNAGKAQQLADATLASLGRIATDGEAKAPGLKSKGHKLLYHARITGLDKDAARQACHSLAKHKHSCKPINLG